MSMIHQLSAETIHEFTVNTLQQQIDLEMSGYRIDNRLAWDVLLKASSEYRSISSVCAELDDSVHHNTLRLQLNQRFDVSTLQGDESAMNATLAALIPQSIRGQAVNVAIDFHDEPYYGKNPENRTYVCRTKAKAGTTRFWRVATAYVMKHGQRVTLAIRYVLPEYKTLDIVQTLLWRVQQQGVRIKGLYMDKGFCSTAVINYLQARQLKAVIACPIRGKTGGTKALCEGKASYTTAYCFTDGTPATICCVRTKVPDRHGKKRVKWLLYVTINVNWTPRTVKKRYRRRFGIEASYRQMRQLRLFSTSRNPALRFFMYGLAFVLLNIWTLLRWKCTRHPGKRRIDKAVFPLARFKGFIRRTIERIRGVIDTIPSYIPLQVLKL